VSIVVRAIGVGAPHPVRAIMAGTPADIERIATEHGLGEPL